MNYMMVVGFSTMKIYGWCSMTLPYYQYKPLKKMTLPHHAKQPCAALLRSQKLVPFGRKLKRLVLVKEARIDQGFRKKGKPLKAWTDHQSSSTLIRQDN